MLSFNLYYAVAFGSYLVGSFPTGVVLSRQKYGIDVREMGSGNIGATNITRVFGWYAGAITFIVDFLKGLLPLWALHHFIPEQPRLLTLAGAFLVLGHCYSAFLKLRGGKGVATSFGCMLAVAPWAALISSFVYAVLLATTRISAIGSLGAMAAAVGYILIVKPPTYVSDLLYAVAFVVLVRHRSNVFRLFRDLRERGKT